MTQCSALARLLRLLLAAILLVHVGAYGQIWPVRQMLEAVKAPVIQLRAKDGTIVDRIDRAWVQRVSEVTQKMAMAYGLAPPALFVDKQGAPNAYVTLHDGGPIMVINTEMLRLVGDSEDLTAAVIGHELGHLKADHLTRGKSNEAIISLIGLFAGALIDANQAKRGVDSHGIGMQLGAAGAGLVAAKYSRDQEREADDLGVRHMARAGFDPHAPSRLWRLMESRGGGSSGLWMASHPSSAERYQTLQTMAASLVPLYAANRPPPKVLPRVADPFPPPRYVDMEPTFDETQADPPAAYRRAMTAHKEKRYADAMAAFQEAAVEGDERALFAVGEYARIGRGRPVDFDAARKSLLAAAEKGFAPAMHSLGLMALEGKGTAKDPAEAARLLLLAEARNVARSAAVLGQMYAVGNGVDKDPAMARQLFEKAANAGDSVGRALFGTSLRDGFGGEPDLARSFSLLQLAAASDYAWAKYQLGISHERGAGTSVDREKALAAYREAAAAGVNAAVQRLKALGY